MRILYSRGSWQKATKQSPFNGREGGRGRESPLEGQQALTEGFLGGWRGGVVGLPPHGTVYTTSLKQLESPYLHL